MVMPDKTKIRRLFSLNMSLEEIQRMTDIGIVYIKRVIKDEEKLGNTPKKNKTTSYIWITTQFEGFHNYPAAPAKVDFLKNLHRHLFKIKVYIEVSHNERDIEFILFKRFVEKCIPEVLENSSCESISDHLYREISKIYPNKKIKIEVSEDGENGCEKEY